MKLYQRLFTAVLLPFLGLSAGLAQKSASPPRSVHLADTTMLPREDCGVRPPSEYASHLKRRQLREYGDTVHQRRAQLANPNTGKLDTTRCVARSDNMACYGEDHLIPLEDGGDPANPKSLWPEPYISRVGGTIIGAHQKDVVEGFVHDEICHDIPGSKSNSYIPATVTITLRHGQDILAGDWYACYESIKKGEPCT